MEDEYGTVEEERIKSNFNPLINVFNCELNNKEWWCGADVAELGNFGLSSFCSRVPFSTKQRAVVVSECGQCFCPEMYDNCRGKRLVSCD